MAAFQCASQHCKSGIACKPRIPPRSDTPTLFSVPGSAWRDRTQITAWVSARESTCVYAALDMHAIGSVSVCYELEKAYENKNSVRRVDVRLLYTVCFRALIRVLRSKGPGSQCGHDDHVFTHRAPDRRTGAAGSAGEDRAQYGQRLMHTLAQALGEAGCQGLSVSNLKNFRQLTLAYPGLDAINLGHRLSLTMEGDRVAGLRQTSGEFASNPENCHTPSDSVCSPFPSLAHRAAEQGLPWRDAPWLVRLFTTLTFPRGLVRPPCVHD